MVEATCFGDFRESNIETVLWKFPQFHEIEGRFDRSLVKARSNIPPTSFDKTSKEGSITSAEAPATY